MRIGFLALFLLTTLVTYSGRAQFTLTPTNPILNAPVKAVAADTSLTSVFLASDTACTSRLTADQVVSSSTHAVTFSLTNSNVTRTYICRSSDSLRLFDLTFTAISYSPKFIFRGSSQTFTFSSNAAVGSTVFLQEFSDCTSGGTGLSQTLNSQYKITGTVSVSYTYFMCISFTSSATGSTVTINLGNVLSTDTAIFTPSSTIRYDSVTFEVSGSARTNANILITSDSFCEIALQGPVPTNTNRQAVFAVNVSKGSYYLCVDASNIFFPAGALTVLEYIVTPRTIFRGVSIPIKLSSDVSSPAQLGFISNTDCTNPIWVSGPMTVTGNSVDLVFNTLGTYYSCVLKPSTTRYVQASQHIVVDPYTATVDRGTDIVRGLSFLVTVSPYAELFVSLVMGTSCSNTAFFSGASVLFKIGGIIPLSGTYTGGTMAVCLQTQDGSYTYPVATASVRDFSIAFEGALIVNVQTQVTIDSALQVGTNPAYKITQANMVCDGAAVTGLGEFSPLPVSRWLTFPSTGTYTFCARSYNASFVALTNLLVFTLPSGSPNSTFANLAFTATITNVPVGIMAGIGNVNCTVLDYNITRTAAMTNVVFTNLIYTVGAVKSMCIYYPTTYSNTQPYVVGSLTISLVSRSPTQAFLGQTTRFALINVDPYLLVGGRAFLTTSGASGCQSSVPSTTYAIGFASTLVKPYVDLTMPSTLTTVDLCVGGNTQASNSYVSAGTVTTVYGVSVIFDPTSPVVNIPFNMEFVSQTGGTTSTQFRISKAEDGCSVAVVEGPLVSMQTTSSITIISENDYNVCLLIGTSSYLTVTTLHIGQLVASPATYVRLMSTALQSSPPVSGLFLTSRSDCGGTRYTASVTSPLSAPVGNYQMCAIISGIAAASSNRVTVIDQYVVTLPDRNLIRSYIPFNATITGGDVSGRYVPVYFIQAVDSSTGFANQCINVSYTSSAVVSRFNASTASPMTVTISGKELVLYKMCIVTADGTSSVELATITPNPYMVPSSLVKGLPVTITSGSSASGYAVISANAECTTPYLLGPVQLVNYLWDNATISATESRNVSYYCEGPTSLSAFTYRGTMHLVTIIAPTPIPPSTFGPGTPVGFEDRYFFPAVPITLSVPAESGYNPFVSHFHDCSDVMIVASGVVPREDEVSSYYVCATTPDGTLNYSRATPNLHVYKYTLSPVIGQSSTSTAVTITPPTLTTSVYFSSDVNCVGGPTAGSSNYLGSASGFNAGLQTLATTFIGVVYVCNADVVVTSTYIPVASFLSVGLPTINSPALSPIRGVPWCLSRTVPKGLFSLVQGADSSSNYSQYYTSLDRRLFLVNSGATCDVANAVDGFYTQATSTGSLCIQTTNLNTQAYRLCTGTPFGFTVQTEQTVTLASPSPSTFVTGTYTETLFPGMPNRSFLFVADGQVCSLSNAVTAPFTTDSSGVTMVSTVSIASGAVLLTPGNYTLCAKLDQSSPSSSWGTVLNDIVVVQQQRFGLNFTAFSVGVNTSVPLLYDLRGSALRNTLSPSSTTLSPLRRVTNSACATTLDSSIGRVSTTNSTTIASITVDVAGVYVVCALTDVNDTMVAVATIYVYPQILEFAPGAMTCDITSVTYLRSVDAASTQTTDIYLNAGVCCGAGNVALNTPSQVLQVVNKPSSSAPNQALRTVSVEETRLALFSPQTAFRMCFSNASICLDTGSITFSGTLCSTGTTSSPNGTSSQVRGAAPRSSTFLDKVPLTLLIVLFCLLLLLVVIICVVCICCCRNRVTPKDESDEEDEEEEKGEWKRNFNAVLSSRNRADDFHGIVDVPIDMRLDICQEPPLAAQDLEVNEGRDRAVMYHYEEELRQKLYAQQAAEQTEIDEWDTARDRESVSRSMVKAVRVPYSDEVVADEEDRRLEIEELEDNARLNIAEMERELWRHHMDTERNILQQQLEADPFWRSRRRQLREANDRALSSINDVALHHNNPHHFSPAHRALSPSKAHPTERMYQGMNRSSSGLQSIAVSPPRGASASVPISPLDAPSRRIHTNVEEETFISDNGDVRTASATMAAQNQIRRTASNSNRAVDPHAVW